MGEIRVHNIRLYAYHGCLEEEAIIGSDYSVDVVVSADLRAASLSDKLKETVDYVSINRAVKEEMGVRSKLLEHVAHRIVDRILHDNKRVLWAEVSVAKINPPLGGDVEKVVVTLRKDRA